MAGRLNLIPNLTLNHVGNQTQSPGRSASRRRLSGDDDASEPALAPKPRAKRGPKRGPRRKRAEVETIDGDGGEPTGPPKLRKRA
jgi:hypothetical protein